MSDVSFVNINGTTYGLNDATPNVVYVKMYQEMQAEDVANLWSLYWSGIPIVGIYSDSGVLVYSASVYASQGYGNGFLFTFRTGTNFVEEYSLILHGDGTWDYSDDFFALGSYIVNPVTGFTYDDVFQNASSGRIVALKEDNANDPTGESDAKGTRIWMLSWYGAKEGNCQVTFTSQNENYQFMASDPYEPMSEF